MVTSSLLAWLEALVVLLCIPFLRAQWQSACENTGCEQDACCPSGYYWVSAEDCDFFSWANGNQIETCNECNTCGDGQYLLSCGSGSAGTCYDCGAGFAKSGTDKTAFCEACDVGKTSSRGSATCSPCAPGTFQPYLAMSFCFTCSNGFSSNAGETSCFQCEIGTAAMAGDGICADCAPGRFGGAAGLSECTTCQAGYFADSARRTECLPCGSGTFSASGASGCSDCQPGEISASDASSSCVSCAKGYFAEAARSTACSACPQGSYGLVTGASACLQCAPGRFNALTAQLGCNGCAPGDFANASGMSQCSICGPGSFSLSTAASCTQCPEGEFNALSGQSRCTPCPAGTYGEERLGAASSETCSPCPAGTANPSPGSAGNASCIDCAAGRYSANESTAICSECPEGRFSDTSGATDDADCNACPAGTYSNSTGAASISECNPCSPGTFSEEPGVTLCSDCEAGRYSAAVGANTAATCTACAPGRFSVTLAATSMALCLPCGPGRYSEVFGATACEDCGPGTWSGATGASDNATCEACPVERFSVASGGSELASCEPCVAGTWSDLLGASVCINCLAGQWSNLTGASEDICENCTSGRFGALPGASSEEACTLCSRGRWSEEGLESCYNCTPGRYSTTDGATSVSTCLGCDPGRFHLRFGAPSAKMCDACPVKTFSNQSGSTACDDCAPGQMSMEGSTECSDCGAGFYSGPDSCEQCQPARYSDHRQESCSQCQAGFIVNALRTGCEPCPIGRYSDLAGAANCTECSAGKFGIMDGQISETAACQDCPAGRHSGTQGLSSQAGCTECGPGTFAEAGAAGCEDCTAGTYQDGNGASVCSNCDAGRYLQDTAATSAAQCLLCPAGTASAAGSSVCSLCARGRYAGSGGMSECLICPFAAPAVDADGALGCCPTSSDSWPSDAGHMLSMPPGKMLSNVHVVGSCEDDIDPEDPATDDLIIHSNPRFEGSGSLSFATIRPAGIHSCVRLECGANNTCSYDEPDSGNFMPGLYLEAVAHVNALTAAIGGSMESFKCPNTVAIGFAGFGCEPGTILLFAVAHLIVVGTTILLAILFELLLRRRVDVFVELALNVSTRDRSSEISTLPAISELHQDVRAALGVSGSELPATRFRAWQSHGAEDGSGPSQLQLECQISAIAGADDSVRKRWTANTNFLFANYTDEYVKELCKKLKSLEWKVAGNWEKSDLTVAAQPPAVVKEVGRLPGADFVDSLEACAYQAMACCCACCTRSSVLPDEEANNLRLRVARATLRALMTRRAGVLLALQAFITLGTAIGLPYAAWWMMTCSTGYPTQIHGAWVASCLGSNFICDALVFLQVRRYSRDVKDFLLRFRLPLLLRFGFTFISVTDLYQDATFPVIAGTCGFDLWFVSAWLVFLGVGIMQILVQLLLVLSCARAYWSARTPEERERHHVEGIFLALRAMDNHLLVYTCRPAVEERLGGASCWKMKTVEARVAFSRFIFEDAEQCALQGIFLYFFESASLADKIWIGLSTATSLSLSFTLAVQTFAEVRDWLWHRLLAKFPLSQSSLFLRWVWLMVLVAIYRAVSAFPWLGSCTPAGDHDRSALIRFFLLSGSPPPQHVLQEVLFTSAGAFGMAFVITLAALCIYRRLLGITRPRRRALQLQDYDFQSRAHGNAGNARVRGDSEEDAWLPALIALHRQAADPTAATLLEGVDRRAYSLSRGTFMAGRHGSEVLAALKHSTDSLYADLNKAKGKLPESSHGACDALKTELQASLQRASLLSTAWALLSDKKFRKKTLLDKARAVQQTTGAPLRLLPASKLPSLSGLPKCPAETLECENAVRMAEKAKKKLVLVYVSHTWASRSHPDNKGKSKLRGLVEFANWFKERSAHQRMDVELYFWIDYCCLSSEEAATALAALPLFISACTEILAWRTPDFDRRGWPLMERLLAYCFCRGGLTPYAIDASTLGERDEDQDTAGDDGGGADGTDSTEVRALLTSAKGHDPAAGKRKVAPAPKLQMVRRQRRLLDPRTAAASRAGGLGASTLQRRVEQLVDMALSVSTLEIFADRQPVDFGLTAVVELWLGPNQPLASKAAKVPDDKSQFSLGKLAWMGSSADPVTGGRWIAASGSAEASKLQQEWSLRVLTPTQGLRALKTALGKIAGGIKADDIQVELVAAGAVAVEQPDRPQGEVACAFFLPVSGDALEELRQRVSQLDPKAFSQQFAAQMLDLGLDVDANHISILEPFRATTTSDPATGESLVRGGFKFAVRQQEKFHDDFIIPVDLPDAIDDATPSDREIQQLFAEVDDLIASQALAAALGRNNAPALGERLDQATSALASALRADLANAMKEGTEQALKDSLGRLQDVSLPETMAARRQLCDLQLKRCVESKNISELTMLLREAESLGADEMTQYAAGKRMLSQLRVRRLQEQSLEVLRCGAKDLESMVAVISVALRRDWEEVLSEGRTLAKAMIDDAKSTGDIMKVAKVWRLADKEGLRVIAAHAASAWEDQVSTARRSEDGVLLAKLHRAATVEGCDPLRQEVLEALRARLKEIEAAWDKAGKKAYQKPLEQLTKDFKSQKAEDADVMAIVKEATHRWKEREQMGKGEVWTILSYSENDPEAVLQCIQTTLRWDWGRVQSKAVNMFIKQVEAALAAGIDTAVATLAKMQQKAQECQVEQVLPYAGGRMKTSMKDRTSIGDRIKEALDGLLKTEVDSKDATRLLHFARAASDVGLAAAAAEARAEMRKILEELQESTSTELIAQFKAAAEAAGDADAVALASEGLAAVEERERKERESEERKLEAAAAQYIGDSVPATCIEVVAVAVRRGWKDLEQRADDLYNNRLPEILQAAAQADPDEAILGYRDLLHAVGRAQELNSPKKQQLRRSLEELVGNAISQRDGVRLLDQYDWSSDNPSFQEFIGKMIQDLAQAWHARGEEAAPKDPLKMAERAKQLGKTDWESGILRQHALDTALRAAKESPSDATKVVAAYELIEREKDIAAESMKKQVEKMAQRVLDEAKQSGDVAALTALGGSGPPKVKKEAKEALDLVEKLSQLLENRKWEGICELASSAQKKGCSSLAKEARNHLRGHVDEVSSTGVIVAETELLLLHKAALKAGLDDFAADLVERLGSAMPKEWAMEKGTSLAVRKDKVDDPILIARLQDMVNHTFQCWGGCRRTRDRRNPLATSLKVEEVLHVANAENYLGYARRRDEIRAAFNSLDPAEKAMDFDIKTQAVSLKGVIFHPDQEPVDASINEVWLWHGTGKEGAHGITETDFDMGRAGSAAGTMFGCGLYFAESCMKSDEYTKADDRKWSPLILCRVTCGRLFHCDWKRPSEHKADLEDKCRTGGYHCILGDRQKVRGTYREFIVFDNDQVYPEYIVWYSRVEPFHDK